MAPAGTVWRSSAGLAGGADRPLCPNWTIGGGANRARAAVTSPASLQGILYVLAVFAIFSGAGLGALLRWGLGLRLNPLFPTLPLGTLAANLVGGLLIGFAVAWLGRHPGLPPELRLFAITGFLGGLTTFSTFSAEVVTLFTRGEYGWGLAAAGSHLAGSLVLTAGGMALANLIMVRH